MDWHNTDSESSDTEPEVVGTCFISEEEADRNYELAGTCVDEPKDEINLEQHAYLLNDDVHLLILEVLEETRLGFKLADFQMLSLHVLGSQDNLVLISPTGSGKMLVVQLGTLLLRKVLRKQTGVSIGTQPLSVIMEEKMRDKTFATAVVTMCGQVKQSLDDSGEAVLSSPLDAILQGDVPILIGHPESWSNGVGQNLLRKLHDNHQVVLHFIDELHQGLESHWFSIRPEMQKIAGRMRIFAEPGAPTVAMSATATTKEVEDMVNNLGLRKKPVVLRDASI